MNSKIIFLCGLLSAISAIARDVQPPALLAKGEDGTLSPLRVDEVEVEVSVVGNTAETVMTLRFRNDTDRILEGELVFPLGEGRTVSRYALEVDGRMREGVAVPKSRGRAVFESIVRRGIDPGLLEWTKGHNFRTRIYPIPAQGTKSVRIGYEEELTDRGDSYRYQLPLAFAEKLDHFRLRVEAAGSGRDGAPPRIEGLECKPLPAQPWIIEAEERNYLANQPLTLHFPRNPEESVSVEERAGELFFHVLDRPVIPSQPRPRPKPKSLHLIWDASHSGAERDTGKELTALKELLAWTGEAVVTLSLLRNDLEDAGSFEVRNGQCAPLVRKLSGLTYDGGTQLGLVNLNLRSAPADLIVLVSDGISTLGEPSLDRSARPVLIMHAAASASHGILRSLARSSGGTYLNLTETGIEDAVRAITTVPFALVKITVEGDTGAIREVYPCASTPVVREVSAAGKLRDEQPVTIVLHYGWGQEANRQQRIRIDPAKHRLNLGRVPRLWAQKKLAALEVDADENRHAITELGKAHGLVTRHTSLIVLDRIEDYVAYRIVPPGKEMQRQYEQLLRDAPDPDQPDPQHLESLLVAWKELVQWHGKDFPGLEKALFKQVKEIRPQLKRLKQIKTNEANDEGVQALVQEMITILEMADHLRGIAKNERGHDWSLKLRDLGKRMQGLAAQSRQVGIPESAGANDPFGGGPEESGFLGRVLGAIGGALASGAGGDATPAAEAPAVEVDVVDDGMAVDALGSPELPSDAGSGGFTDGGLPGGFGFPVTPASPSPFGPEPGEVLTAGLRSGAAAITQNSIDAILNDPDRRQPQGDGDGADDPFAASDPEPVKPPAYLTALQAAKDLEALRTVFTEWREKIENEEVIAFLLDASDEFLAKKDRTMALRSLTTLAELAPEHVGLLRILGHRLDQLGELELAEKVFREVHSLREEEPQSWRDLALVLEKRGQHQEALDLLWSAISREWDGRFGQIQLILLNELNALLTRHRDGLDLAGLDKRFLYNLDCDLRVVLTWDADSTDVDLWVTGPSGERCFYDHNQTLTGGRLSEDLTRGYGPEEFLIKKVLPGSYQVHAHFYGNHRQDLTGTTTLQAVLVRDWGRPSEKREAITLRLRSTNEVVAVGEMAFDPKIGAKNE